MYNIGKLALAMVTNYDYSMGKHLVSPVVNKKILVLKYGWKINSKNPNLTATPGGAILTIVRISIQMLKWKKPV